MAKIKCDQRMKNDTRKFKMQIHADDEVFGIYIDKYIYIYRYVFVQNSAINGMKPFC